MEAPDKIYLAKSLSFPDKIHRQWYKEDVVGNGIEYIRKDILIDWLDKKVNDFGHTIPFRIAIQCTIDKINSL